MNSKESLEKIEFAENFCKRVLEPAISCVRNHHATAVPESNR